MSPCPKCGGKQWKGPSYILYQTGIPGDWPLDGPGPAPLPEALMYKCATCNFPRFARTVQYGGEPVPEPAPKPRKTDKKAS